MDRLTLVAPETLWLHEIDAKDDLIAEKLTLKGSAADGPQIESTSVFMLKLKAASHPARAAFAPSACAAALTVKYRDYPNHSPSAVRVEGPTMPSGVKLFFF